MKKYTYYTIFIFVCLLFVSCAYEAKLITLQGSNLVSRPEGLLLETDTLLLKYDFYSPLGQIRFTLYNKLTVPLYIDWKKSAYIMGKIKNDYWID
jgi:hypothetical protein